MRKVVHGIGEEESHGELESGRYDPVHGGGQGDIAQNETRQV
jgi:hypothetical protein